MNLIGVTINYICLFFISFLTIIYISKKKRMTVENLLYMGMLVCNFAVIASELSFLYLCFYINNNMYLIGLPERVSSTFLNMFFIFIFFYASFICLENNKAKIEKIKMKSKLFYLLVLCFFIIISVFEMILPLYYHYSKFGMVDYVYGPAFDGVAIVVGAIILICFIPILIKNWKNTDKKKISPMGVVIIFEMITLIVSIFAPTICLASVSLTATCYLMYMTIENPDLKLIKELELAKNQAEKSNNAKSDFLSSMSHELRTPLNAIVGLSQMIQVRTQEDETKEDATDILKASNSLLELVDGILEINKLDANQMDLVNKNYNLLEIINEMEKIIKIRIGDKPIELRTRVSDIPSCLYGDKDKIRRIFLNILSNAVKYTNEGYIDFVVDAAIIKDKCNLRISVSDTGRGISEEQMPLLFTKFNRREEDKDTDIEGTGLGLAITKSLVDLMDGKISVNSNVGEGTTFTVTLNQKVVVDNNVEII